jgi:flavin reductase (DIM6/NTAB) family NADH-FMN oxidoreductase RutF
MAKKLIDKGTAHRLLGGGPVVLVASRYRDRVNVMAASWVTPISMDPPMVAVAIHKSCLTHDFIERSGEFTLSVPPRSLMERVRDAGMVSGYDVDDKVAMVGLRLAAAQALDTPVVAGCLGHLECTVVEAYDAGQEHTVFFAEVAAAAAEAEAFDDTWLLTEPDAKPLHHLGGHTYSLLDARIDAEPRAEEG